MRDSSFLYTGSSSSTPPSVVERLKTRADKLLKRKQEQSDIRVKLKPSAEVIFEAIDAEKQAVMLVKDIDFKLRGDDLKVELLARRKYLEYLDGMKNRLTIVLREDKEVAT